MIEYESIQKIFRLGFKLGFKATCSMPWKFEFEEGCMRYLRNYRIRKIGVGAPRGASKGPQDEE